MVKASMCLYNESLVESEAWMAYREEISDLDGKGDALVAVNPMLMWIQEQEEEDDDDDSEDSDEDSD